MLLWESVALFNLFTLGAHYYKDMRVENKVVVKMCAADLLFGKA